MKKILFLIAIVGGMFLLMSNSSCESGPAAPSADEQLEKQTEQAMQEANRQTGYPAIINFQEKKVMKAIYELRDQEDLVCYAYFFNELKGELGSFIGKCIGYGLPYSTQFSNPERVENGGYNGAYWGFGMPQPEPNGLFMPEGLAATWLLLLDDEGVPHPVYIEPTIVVSPFPLK